MRVSTVIPVYNRPSLVGRAIESAMAQDIDGHEIIVIDNCSTDNTWQVLCGYAQRDERVRCIRNDTNIGPVRNWLKGVQAGLGDYCHLLFSDDTIEPQFLRRSLELFDARTGYVISGHRKCNDGVEVDRSTFQERAEISREEILEAIVFSNPKRIQVINPVGVLFRRCDLIDAILPEIENPFGIDFNGHGAGPDMSLFAIIASRYELVRCIDAHLAVMHSHQGSITVQSGDLRFPREWARWNFVRKYWPRFTERYFAALWVQCWRNTQLRPIFAEIRRVQGARPRARWVIDYLRKKLVSRRGR